MVRIVVFSVFNQGDDGKSWYILLKGSVNVVIYGKVLVAIAIHNIIGFYSSIVERKILSTLRMFDHCAGAKRFSILIIFFFNSKS